MGYEYFLYRTDYNNTLVDRSNTSFAPYPPNTYEVYSDYLIPITQPLYLYRYDDINNVIIVNDDETINDYLSSIAPPPAPDDPIEHEIYTGYTAATEVKLTEISASTTNKIDKVTGATDQVPVFLDDGSLNSSGFFISDLTGNTSGDTGNGMVWYGKWKNITYPPNSVVTDVGWLMISNKETTERAAPQDVDDPFYYYSGSNMIETTYPSTVNSLTVGQRYTTKESGYIKGFRFYIYENIGYTYRIIYADRSDFNNPIFKIGHEYEFDNTGIQEVLVDPIFVLSGKTFDLLMEIQNHNNEPTKDILDYQYTTPTTLGAVGSGVISHADDNLNIIRVSSSDYGGNQTTILDKITIGDEIEINDTKWEILGVTKDTYSYDFEVDPEIQYSPDGRYNVIFYHYEGGNISYLSEDDYWLNDTSVMGLIQENDYKNPTENNIAYPIDILVQKSYISDDWDYMSSTNTVGIGGNNGDSGDYVNIDDFTGYTATTETKLTNIENDINYISGITDTKLDENIFSDYSGTTMIWYNEWINTEYQPNSVVIDDGWLMISNKLTTDKAAPQSISDPYYIYNGGGMNLITNPNLVNYLAVGQRYINQKDGLLSGYRFYVGKADGYEYKLVFIDRTDPQNIITKFGQNYTFSQTGVTEVSINPIFLLSGHTFDFLLLIKNHSTGTTLTNIKYNYLTPNNATDPNNGEINHANRELNILRVSKIDYDGNDQSSFLSTIKVGDEIEIETSKWEILNITNKTNSIDFEINPEVQFSNDGIYDVNFYHYAETTIEYNIENDYWSTTSYNIKGLIQENGFDNLTENDNAYPIDILVEDMEISEDWDFMASTETVGGGSAKSYNFIESGGTSITVDGEDVTIYSPPIEYDGYDIEQNILNLSGSEYENQKWFATDTKNVFKYIEYNSNWLWLGENIIYNDDNHEYELPKDETNYIHTIGKELFSATINTETSIVTTPHVFILTNLYSGSTNLITSRLCLDGDIGITSVYGINATTVNPDERFKLIVYGVVKQIDTSLWSPNTKLYVSDTTPGELTDLPPNSNSLPIGYVVKQDNTDGIIFVDCIRQSKNVPINIPLNFSYNYLTGDLINLNGVDFYKISTNDKGTVDSVVLSKNLGDNEKFPLDYDFISDTAITDTIIYSNVYDAQLQIVIDDDGGQEKIYIEIYDSDENGNVIDSGLPDVVVGDLGVKPIMNMQSPLSDLAENVTTNVYLSDQLEEEYTLLQGHRLRYHILVEKVGTAGVSKTFYLYVGNVNNSFIRSLFKLKLGDLSDVDVSQSVTGDVLMKNASGLWVGGQIESTGGLQDVVNIGEGVPLLSKNNADVVGNTIKGKGNIYVQKSGDTVYLNYVSTPFSGSSYTIYFYEYFYLNHTTDSDPGATYMKLNNLDPTLVTEAYIDYLNIDQIDYRRIWESAKQGDLFFLRQKDDATIKYEYNVTQNAVDMGGYIKLFLEYKDSNGSPPFNRVMLGLVAYDETSDDITYILDNKIDVIQSSTENNIPSITSNGMLQDSSLNLDDIKYPTLRGFIQLEDNVGGQSVNVDESNATSIVWSDITWIDNEFYDYNTDSITIKKDGYYMISYNITTTLLVDARTQTGFRIYINDVYNNLTFTSAYSRNIANPYMTNTLPPLLLNLNANDVIKLKGFYIGDSHNVNTYNGGTNFINIKYYNA